MHSSSPVRTQKLQQAIEKPLTGECWIPAKKKKKKIHHIQGQRRSHNKMVGGVKSCLESKLRPPEMLRGFKQNLMWTRTWGTHKRLSQICLWVFECLLQWHGSTVACHGNRGSGCSRPRRQSMWASPESHRADNPQTGEQLDQRSSRTVALF